MWENNIRMDLKEIYWEGVDWMQMTHLQIKSWYLSIVRYLQIVSSYFQRPRSYKKSHMKADPISSSSSSSSWNLSREFVYTLNIILLFYHWVNCLLVLSMLSTTVKLLPGINDMDLTHLHRRACVPFSKTVFQTMTGLTPSVLDILHCVRNI
jgi:hypothetical protein